MVLFTMLLTVLLGTLSIVIFFVTELFNSELNAVCEEGDGPILLSNSLDKMVKFANDVMLATL